MEANKRLYEVKTLALNVRTRRFEVFYKEKFHTLSEAKKYISSEMRTDRKLNAVSCYRYVIYRLR